LYLIFSVILILVSGIEQKFVRWYNIVESKTQDSELRHFVEKYVGCGRITVEKHDAILLIVVILNVAAPMIVTQKPNLNKVKKRPIVDASYLTQVFHLFH